jgi:hypothetical protein
MIPTLIIWLIKKYLLNSKKSKQRNHITALTKTIIPVILFVLFAIPAIAQRQAHRYIVLYRGKNVGAMYLTQIQSGDELSLKVTSNIQMHMLMSIKVNVAEESSYKQDKLISSSVYREVNGKEKANRQTRYCNGCYEIITEGKRSVLNKTSIQYNLVRLYCREPIGFTQVYSDAFQQFLNLKALSAHKYRLELPDGNFNVYSYQNGICSKVEVHSTFYTIQMQLVE